MHDSRRATRPRFTARKLVIAIAAVTALIAAGLAGRWYWRVHQLETALDRGLELLAQADAPGEAERALAQWEKETGRAWQDRREDLLARAFSKRNLTDKRLGALLTRVSGVDYGDRAEDWKRWYAAHQRLQKGQQPKLTERETIRFTERWQTPVGLTAWYTAILLIDGQIYVPSLGTAFEDESDTADGVVRVDGKTGQSELIFEPPDRGARDVLGLAAGKDCLFVACRNGFAYCIDPDGKLRWKAEAGAPLAAAPLALDINRDEIPDMIVITRQDTVIAFNGPNGKTLWVAPGAGRAARGGGSGASFMPAALAAGDVLEPAGPEIIATTPEGAVRVLNAQTGAVRWQRTIPAGILTGTLTCGGRGAGGPPAFVADRDGKVWSLVRSGRGLETIAVWAPPPRWPAATYAKLRAVGDGVETAPWILFCPIASVNERGASVCALAADGMRWSVVLGGAVWATPAVADLNGDRQPEILVASTEADGAGGSLGLLTILSHDGHFLRRYTLGAPVECAPVVGDIDGNGNLEVLIADTAGLLHCYSTNGFGPVEWGLYGGDIANTANAANAYAYSQAPFGYQWRWRPKF